MHVAASHCASSHASPGSTIPLPHVASSAQSAEHPSPLIALPSSQASPGSTIQSPHVLVGPVEVVLGPPPALVVPALVVLAPFVVLTPLSPPAPEVP